MSKKIMFDSDESAKIITVTGWVSNNGNFFGNDENTARWDGCTHRKCATDGCHATISKSRYYCKQCYEGLQYQKYNEMDYKKWDGCTPLYSITYDEYFMELDDIETYIDNSDELQLSDFLFVICEPVYVREIDDSYFVDHIEFNGALLVDLYPSLSVEIEKINEKIRNEKTVVGWEPGKYRTGVKL